MTHPDTPALLAADEMYRELLTLTEAQRRQRNATLRDAVAAGMTQTQAAKLLGIGQSRVSQIIQEAAP